MVAKPSTFNACLLIGRDEKERQRKARGRSIDMEGSWVITTLRAHSQYSKERDLWEVEPINNDHRRGCYKHHSDWLIRRTRCERRVVESSGCGRLQCVCEKNAVYLRARTPVFMSLTLGSWERLPLVPPALAPVSILTLILTLTGGGTKRKSYRVHVRQFVLPQV